METIDYLRMHAELLCLLGANDHDDAKRIIADHHARELSRQSEGVSESVVFNACESFMAASGHTVACAPDHMRAALTAGRRNRPAQEKAEPADGVMHARIGCDSDTEWFVELVHCLHTVRTAPTFPTREKAEAYLRGIELWLPTPHAERVRVPDGWRVMRCTGSFPGDSDCWEIYDPSGSGGVITPSDVPEATVRGLLDALSAAPEASSHG